MQHTRRDFLKQLTMVLGATSAAALLTESSLANAMNFHQLDGSSNVKHGLFTDMQKAVLFDVCDAVLPRTDTPSATETDCHRFIEHQLVHCHSEQEQANCQAILEQIEVKANESHKQSFTALSTEQQQSVLVDIEKLNGVSEEQKQQFTFLKGLLVFGYFTSEAGATQALSYLAVPGGFKGSIPYDENSKAWGARFLY